MVELIGIHFQIRDDYMNLQSSQVHKFDIMKATLYLRHESKPTPFHSPCLIVLGKQGLLWRLDRRQILLSYHPLYSCRSWKSQTAEYDKLLLAVRYKRRQPTHRYLTTRHCLSLLDILKQKPTELELKHHAVKIMEGTQTFAYCREQMAKYEALTRAEVRRLGGNVRLERIIDLLSVPDPAVDSNKNAVPSFVAQPNWGHFQTGE